MKILNLLLTNFASYEQLAFDFQTQGLSLIHGDTGSGKSTLCDGVPWVLWGATAKGGPVSDVLSWPGDKVTEGTLHLQTFEGLLTVYRARGPKAKDNDLTFNLGADPNDLRGKDLPDTQRLINAHLGMSLSTYLAGSYYHEFSETAQFFNTTAKNRRAICEQLVDLSLAKNLQEKLSANHKETYNGYKKTEQEQSRISAKIETLATFIDSTQQSIAVWDETQKTLAEKADKAILTFEAVRKEDLLNMEAKLADLGDKLEYHDDTQKELEQQLHTLGHEACTQCGANIKHAEHYALKARAVANQYALHQVSQEIDALMANIALRQHAAPPPKHTYQEPTSNIDGLQTQLQKLVDAQYANEILLSDLESQVDDMLLLQEVIADFRSALITTTISQLQDKTNELLTKHFDAEIRITFSASEADKIDVEITKDGNICSYTQLSKGQRQLLRLSFGVAVMQAVSNHHGTSFNCLFFDEALDGLSEEFKLKAVGLFEQLAVTHESVFVVEHSSAIKAFFTKQFQVTLVDGRSQIYEL